MNCYQESSLHAYHDGELDALAALEFESHLRQCPICAEALQSYQNLRQSLQNEDSYFKVPPGLETSIRARIRPVAVPKNTREWFFDWRLGATAASIIVVFLFSYFLLSRPSNGALLAQEVVAAHVRSLMASHLTDVDSTDQHTVKPWFTGKLDFSPSVADFAKNGFPLIGGRLDYLNDRPVAALVYKHRQHVINLFVWPSKRASSSTLTFDINGFNVISWTQSGMTYWAVSDLNQPELRQFCQNIKAR